METMPTSRKDTFIPKILLIVCCTVVVIGTAYLISSFVLQKQKNSTPVTVSSNVQNNFNEPEKTITEENPCVNRGANLVFVKDKEIVACQRGGGNKLIHSGVVVDKDPQGIVSVESFTAGYQYFISIYEEDKTSELARSNPVKSYIYDGINEVFGEVIQGIYVGGCSAYDSERNRLFNWSCGGEGSANAIPVTVQNTATEETKTLISQDDIDLGNHPWTEGRVWFGRGVLFATDSYVGTGNKIITYNLDSDVLEPVVYLKQK